MIEWIFTWISVGNPINVALERCPDSVEEKIVKDFELKRMIYLRVIYTIDD